MLTTIPSPARVDLSAIDRLDRAESYKRKLSTAILRMVAAGISPKDTHALRAYADGLPVSGRAFLKAGLRVMLSEYTHQLKASATPANILSVQAALLNIEAMDDTLTTRQPEPERLPHWLTQQQVDAITTLAFRASLRDYIVLALLLGTGLRREELSTLSFDALSTVDDRPVLTVKGKGAKVRTIPITSILYRHLLEWKAIAGPGRIARKVNKSGKVGASLAATAIFDIVRKYGAQLGITDLDPHDCRRTFGRLVYQATGDIIKVRSLLGHSKTETTEKYIGLRLDLEPVNIIHTDFTAITVAGD